MDGFLQLGNASIVGIDIEFEIAAPSVAVAASIDTKFKEQLKKPDDLLAMFKGSGLKHVTQVKIDFKLAQVVSATGATGATGAANAASGCGIGPPDVAGLCGFVGRNAAGQFAISGQRAAGGRRRRRAVTGGDLTCRPGQSSGSACWA